MGKILKILRTYERMILIGIIILFLLFFYGEKRHQDRMKNLKIDVHGTYFSQQVSDYSGKPYPKTWYPLYFVFNSEDHTYMIHRGGPIIEFGTYKESEFVKNVIYIETNDKRKSMISINPQSNTFVYSFDNDSDDVRVFSWQDRGMYLGDFENNINPIGDEVINGPVSFTKDIFIDEDYSLKLLVDAKVEENIIKSIESANLETGNKGFSGDVQFYITTDKIIEYYISGNIYNKGKTTRTKDGKEGSSSFKSDNETESNIYETISDKGLITIWERNLNN